MNPAESPIHALGNSPLVDAVQDHCLAVRGLSRYTYEHWISYLIGRVLQDEDRVYSIKFIWYGDSVYLHPLVWGSFVLYFVDLSDVFTPGWPLLVWFILLAVCFLTVIYNFDIIKASVLLVCVVAVFSLAYIANTQWHWNPPRILAHHIQRLKPEVTPGFYVVAAYVFLVLIAAEVVWAWLFNRVEIDESYVYEHRCLQSTSREPIFARGLDARNQGLVGVADPGRGGHQAPHAYRARRPSGMSQVPRWAWVGPLTSCWISGVRARSNWSGRCVGNRRARRPTSRRRT